MSEMVAAKNRVKLPVSRVHVGVIVITFADGGLPMLSGSPNFLSLLLAGAAGAIVALTAAAVFQDSIPPAHASEPQVVRSTRFELIDASGRVRGALALDGSGSPRLSLADASGRSRIEMFVLASGVPGLVLYDEGGVGRISFVTDAQGAPALVLSDALGKSGAMLHVDQSGAPSLWLRDQQGRERTVAP